MQRSFPSTNLPADEQVTVYILLCKDGSYYCGITNNILRRMLEHAAGGTRYTRLHRIHRLVYVQSWPDRHTAALHERSIKRHGVKRSYLSLNSGSNLCGQSHPLLTLPPLSRNIYRPLKQN